MFNRIEIVGFSLILLLLVGGLAFINVGAFLGLNAVFVYGLLFMLSTIPVGLVTLFLVEALGNE
jgi:hypothetical protein